MINKCQVGVLTLNRSGLVTDTSQPGKDEAPWLQRAFVDGFCDAETAERLRVACWAAGIDTIIVSPDRRPRVRTSYAVRIPVTCRDGVEHTWLGAVESARSLRQHWHGYLCQEGLDALLGASLFTAYDPEWGRKDLLWETLVGAVA